MWEARQSENGVNRVKLLSIKNLNKTFGAEKILNNLSFDLYKGECLAVIGRSGRGKSTLLNILAGLDRDYSGQITGEVKLSPSLDKAYIYQGIEQLFPWKTTLENIQLPMIKKGYTNSEVEEKSTSLLSEVQLNEHGDKYPNALSGGMKQRAILARAIGYDPKIILLDEPFSHLDDAIREKLQNLLLSLKASHHLTMVFVTHDLHEAIKVSDRILLLDDEITIVESLEKDAIKEAYWLLYRQLSGIMKKEQNI